MPTKTVLITGGSGGIGSAIAQEAASNGWTVFAGFHQGQDHAKKIASGNNLIHPVVLSSDIPDSIEKALDVVAAQGNRLDTVVLAASPAPVLDSFLKAKPEDFLKQIDVNLIFHQNLLVQVWKRFFSSARGGHVIGISSRAMDNPVWPHMSSYVVGKKALETLLECAQAELGTSGLRATSFHLNYTETPMLTSVHPHVLESARSKQKDGKFLDPGEVAQKIFKSIENPPASPALHVVSI